MKLIEEIARKRTYYPVCKKIAKRDWLTDELHQEFLTRLVEIGEAKLIEVRDTPNEPDYIKWFCMDVISKIWANRNRVKAYKVGSTNPLFELTSTNGSEIKYTFVEDGELIELERPSPIQAYDFQIDYDYKEVKKEIEKDIQSDNKDLNYKARVFTYSVGLHIQQGRVKEGGKYKNMRQFSQAVRIPYISIYKAATSYLEQLKTKLK